MEPFSFVVETADISKTIQIAKDKIKKEKGWMDKTKFEAKGFEGYWRQVPSGLEITITKKPMLAMFIGAEEIERLVEKFFSDKASVQKTA